MACGLSLQPSANKGSALRFRMENRPGTPEFLRGWQKHHLLPRQLRKRSGLGAFWSAMAPYGLSFDDFRTNGVLLPATELKALKQQLPLHRGPHRPYNDVVAERVGAIERWWAKYRDKRGAQVDMEAWARLSLLQRALRRRLKRELGRPITLNSKDPIGQGVDFSTLDSMADEIWGSTARI